jgi:ribosomal protein S18 acetylase RimI-like enzyme
MESTSEIVIRLARPEEVNTVTGITDAAYEHYIPRLGRKPQPMLTDYNPMIAAHEVWLLEFQYQPVGVLVLMDKQDHLLIYNIAIHPSHQKRGLGRRLLLWAEEQTKQTGYSCVRLYTNSLMTENIGIYTNFGYHETRREPYLNLTIVHMEKCVVRNT